MSWRSGVDSNIWDDKLGGPVLGTIRLGAGNMVMRSPSRPRPAARLARRLPLSGTALRARPPEPTHAPGYLPAASRTWDYGPFLLVNIRTVFEIENAILPMAIVLNLNSSTKS